MKILKTAQAYYPFQEKGGPVVKVRAIALGLAQRGHSVAILTPDWGFQPSMAPMMAAEKCRWGWCAQEQGVKAIFLRGAGHYRTLSLNPGMVSFSRASLGDFDVVHLYGLYDLLGPTVAFFCRRNHIPYVVEPMGMFRPIVRNIGLKKAYHRVLGKRLLDGAHRLIATSDQEKRELVEGGVEPGRVIVRRNGVEIPQSVPERGVFREEWQIPSRAKMVLYLGRLEPKKSPELLVEAFAQWRKTSQFGANSVLVIAGPEHDRAYSAQVKSWASSLRITDAVRFTGPLYEERKWAAYRDADLFVLPSQNENFGNSAAEAMACGTPVIVTDQCGIAPIIKGRAGLIVSHDSASIAAALKIGLEDEDAAARFRNACPLVVKELSWDEPISEMVEIYREALTESLGTR
ncbi:MAG: glycosyltransferase [Candidatus Acidiferrales bacterium]